MVYMMNAYEREGNRERENMDDDDELVGFRFYPTEEELLCYYLPNKLNGTIPEAHMINTVIPLVQIYDYSPWDLPKLAGEVCRADTEQEQWFFFTGMQERESRGGRRSRLTENGYWKATGSPYDVYNSQNHRIGRKKTMVFYEGRAPGGTKTTWKMNEYKVYETSTDQTSANPQLKEELSLCRIYKRSNCSRAFDRRPSYDQATAQYYHQQHYISSTDEAVNVITTDNQQNIPAVECELFNWDMTTTHESGPLTDSDILMLLNWFDI